jgi:hypothetical protein
MPLRQTFISFTIAFILRILASAAKQRPPFLYRKEAEYLVIHETKVTSFNKRRLFMEASKKIIYYNNGGLLSITQQLS